MPPLWPQEIGNNCVDRGHFWWNAGRLLIVHSILPSAAWLLPRSERGDNGEHSSVFRCDCVEIRSQKQPILGTQATRLSIEAVTRPFGRTLFGISRHRHFHQSRRCRFDWFARENRRLQRNRSGAHCVKGKYESPPPAESVHSSWSDFRHLNGGSTCAWTTLMKSTTISIAYRVAKRPRRAATGTQYAAHHSSEWNIDGTTQWIFRMKLHFFTEIAPNTSWSFQSSPTLRSWSLARYTSTTTRIWTSSTHPSVKNCCHNLRRRRKKPNGASIPFQISKLSESWLYCVHNRDTFNVEVWKNK